MKLSSFCSASFSPRRAFVPSSYRCSPSTNPLLVLALLFLQYLRPVSSSRIDGTVTIEPDKLTYITDFCYGKEGGLLSYNVVTDLASGLVLYDDENWNYVTTHDCNCSCLQAYTLDQTIHFLVPGGTGDTGQIMISTPNQKPAYIYTAFLTCAEATKVTYHLHFTRDVPASSWPEIPYDAIGLLETNAISTAIGCAITLILLCRYNWWSQKHWYLTPPPVKIFGLACILWLASSACILTHFVTFAQNGYGQANVEGFGRVADVLSRLVFMALLLALARGWNIMNDQWQQESSSILLNNKTNNSSNSNFSSSRGNVAFRRRCGGIFLIGSLAVIYIIMAVWYLVERLPGDVTYVYDSVPGITVSIVQAVTGLWYFFDSRSTIKTLQSIMKSRTANTNNTTNSSSSSSTAAATVSYMYGSSMHSIPYLSMQINWLKTSLIFLLYFAALPIAVLIGYVALPNFDDEKTVEVTLQSSRIIFYGTLLYLFSPTRTDRLFSTWQPENSVVKLLRPEISSVDLLTPVLSGYASPGGMYNGGNLPLGRSNSRRPYGMGPGSGYASGSRTPKQRTGTNNNGSSKGSNGRYGTNNNNGASLPIGKSSSNELPYIHEEQEDEKESRSLLLSSSRTIIGTTDNGNDTYILPLNSSEISVDRERNDDKEERKRKKLAKKEKKKEKERERQARAESFRGEEEEGRPTVSLANETKQTKNDDNDSSTTLSQYTTAVRVRGSSLIRRTTIEEINEDMDAAIEANPQTGVLRKVLEQDFFRE